MKLKAFISQKIFLLPAYFICIALLFPLLLVVFQLKSLAWPEFSKMGLVFFMTVLQASLSAFLSVFLGLLSSRGLLSFSHKRYYFLIESVVLLPCLIPPLVMMLSLVHLTELFMPFPFGLTALILVQTLSWIGLCAVVFARLFLREAFSLSEWAYLQSSSPLLFLKTAVKSFLLKDIKVLWVLVFSSCFTSLSFPLLTAGSSLFSLEFFIYEHLKNPQLWSTALSLILLQSFFVFFICFKAFQGNSPADFEFFSRKIYLLPKLSFLVIPLSACFFSLGGLVFISNTKTFQQLFSLTDLIFSAGINSLLIGLGTGGLTLLFLIFMSLSFQNLKARKFISAFMPPGASFFGLAFLLWPFYSEGFVIIKWFVGMGLLFFPWIYRFRGERALEKLTNQVEIAKLLGASYFLIFRKIIWPQSRSVFFLCAGLAGFWACGEFSYSLIVSNGHWNLSLVVYDLFNSYRLDLAVLLSWLLLFLSFFIFLFWQGVRFVFSKKFVL